MKTIGYGLSDVGHERELNEDALLIDDALGIYAVSDGLGGHAAGEEASRLAIAAVHEAVRAGRKALPEQEDLRKLRGLGSTAMKAACARVYSEATSNPELAGMGCTLTLVLTTGSKAIMAHVGDTRLYLNREGSTWQLSSDHTLAADLVRRGEITIDDAATHPHSSALTRALGSQESIAPEVLMLDLLPDDVLLLCSDGLSQYIEGPSNLSPYLSGDELSDAPRELVEHANSRGGQDNITVVAVRVVAEDREREAVLSEEVRAGLAALRKVPAFGDGRFADLLRIFECAEVHSYAEGEVVAAEESHMHILYIPLTGELQVESPEGSSQRVKRGEALGLTSLLVPRVWSGRVVAKSDVRLLEVEREAFLRVAHRRPWMGVRVFAALALQLGAELPDYHHGANRSNPSPWWDLGRWLRPPAS